MTLPTSPLFSPRNLHMYRLGGGALKRTGPRTYDNMSPGLARAGQKARHGSKSEQTNMRASVCMRVRVRVRGARARKGFLRYS